MLQYMFDMTLALAKVLTNVWESKASGSGTTTTLVDDKLTQPNGYFEDPNDGILWLIITSSNSYHRITDYSFDITKITFTPAAGSAPGAFTRYAACPGYYPLPILEQAVNEALQNDIGRVPMIWEYTLTANKQDYDSTDESVLFASGNEIFMIEIATSTAAPYDYRIHYRWRHEWRTIGGSSFRKTLHFLDDAIPDGAYKARIHYKSPQPVIRANYTYAPTEAEATNITYPEELLLWSAAVRALRWRLQLVGGQDQFLLMQLNEAEAKAAQAKAKLDFRFKVTPVHSRW